MFCIPPTREQPDTRIEKLSICIATFSSAILAPVMTFLLRSVKIIERRTSVGSPAKVKCFTRQRPSFELALRIPFRYFMANHVLFFFVNSRYECRIPCLLKGGSYPDVVYRLHVYLY